MPKPFPVPFSVPPLASPVKTVGTTDYYGLTMRQSTAQVIPGYQLPSKHPTLGYSTRQHEPQVDVSRIDSTYLGAVTVSPDAVLVLGDNRAASIDSRTYGSIRVDDLVGRVALSL